MPPRRHRLGRRRPKRRRRPRAKVSRSGITAVLYSPLKSSWGSRFADLHRAPVTGRWQWSCGTRRRSCAGDQYTAYAGSTIPARANQVTRADQQSPKKYMCTGPACAVVIKVSRAHRCTWSMAWWSMPRCVVASDAQQAVRGDRCAAVDSHPGATRKAKSDRRVIGRVLRDWPGGLSPGLPEPSRRTSTWSPCRAVPPSYQGCRIRSAWLQGCSPRQRYLRRLLRSCLRPLNVNSTAMI